MRNLDTRTADGFDRIWALHGPSPEREERDTTTFDAYFSIFPFEQLANSEGFDLGAGNGRIARHIAPRVRLLHCIEPSQAGITVARDSLRHLQNVRFHQSAVDAIPLEDGSQEFGYSVGVLHQIPDPEARLRACVAKLKAGAPFLIYVYYSLDNRPAWFRMLWRASDVARRLASRLPFRWRVVVSDLAAATLYWPLSRAARVLEKLGAFVDGIPLSYYRNHNWATLRADALDRLGTAVEHRFSKIEVEEMMRRCGLTDVSFAEGPPYWVGLGYRQ